MKKIISLLCFIALCFSFAACTPENTDKTKLTVVTTLFPQYDFAKAIGGDLAEVTLLLKPGTDSHSFEPTASDMVKIAESDIFIYTGDNMEAWASTLLSSFEDEDVFSLDVSKGIDVKKTDDVLNLHIHEHNEHTENVYDPHIWTDPVNAKIIAENILEAFILKDSENAEYYKKNAEKLLANLDALDSDFKEFFDSVENKKIAFGGRFAMYYFAKRYDIKYTAAYDTCSTEGEASLGKVRELIESIKEENLGAIYYEELSLSSYETAKLIEKEAGVPALLLHNCHNISKDDFENGETYISLMYKNLDNLKLGMK